MENDNKNIDSSNIFEDFQDSTVLKEDIQKIEVDTSKDRFYYIKAVGKIIKYINILLLVIILIAFLYVYIQKSESKQFYNNQILEPFCFILLGENLSYEEDFCSSVTSIKEEYNNKIKAKQEVYISKIIPNLVEMYGVYDFMNSEKVAFTINKTSEKINPIDILSEFDKIRNDFMGVDRGQIECSGIKISGNDLSLNCYVFTRGWEYKILGEGGISDNNKMAGTSISKASSFLNFIELSKKFKIKNKQKVFNSQKLVGPYSTKTDIVLDLTYNNSNLLLK